MSVPTDYYSIIAKKYDQVGERLTLSYGNDPIPKQTIENEFCHISKYAIGSVSVTDYCYNLINKAKYSFLHPRFEYIGYAKFRYLGPNYNYNGDIIWRPKGKAPRVVGHWINGKYELIHDPRK